MKTTNKLNSTTGSGLPAASCSLRSAFQVWITAFPYNKSVDRFPEDGSCAWPGSYKDINTDLAWNAFKTAHEQSLCTISRVKIGVSRIAKSTDETTREHAKRLLGLF